MIAESSPQCSERWLAGTVARGNELNPEPIVERSDDLVDVCIGCCDEMKTTNDKVNVRIDGACGLDDVVDTGMRTTDNNN